MTVVIGTAGHIDHGKTTLLRALTGIDADRLPDERRRGMTLDVGYAHLAVPDGTSIDFVDVPGHDRLVGNMLVGAGEIDAALLVVAADDGPRPQTVEHVALLDALGISHGAVAITKVDLVDRERVDEVRDIVAERLAGTSLAGAATVEVSAVSGAGIGDLRDALVVLRDRVLAAGTSTAPRPPRLPIDRVFGVKGRGVVVTGTLRGAPLEPGQTLRVVPGEGTVRIREIQVHGSAVGTAREGGRTALNVSGDAAALLRRGVVLTAEPAIVATDRLLVQLARTVADRARYRFHLGTEAVEATVGRSGRDDIHLGDGAAAAILRLERPVAAVAGDRFVLRRSGRDAIVGGVVLDPEPARGVSRRRQTPDRVANLAEAVLAASTERVEAARIDLHGALAGALARDVGAALRAAALDAVAAHHAASPADPGMSLAAVRSATERALRREAWVPAGVAARLATDAVDAVVRERLLVRDGDRVRDARHRPRLADPDDAAAMDRLERALAVLTPPSLAAAAAAERCAPAGVRELERAGRIVVVAPDLAYAMTTYRELAATALRLAARGPLTPAAFRDATGASRKYVMPILEDLDRRAILRRTPDGHVPGPRAPRAATTTSAGGQVP